MKTLLARLGALTKGIPGTLLIAAILGGAAVLFSYTEAHDRLEYVFYDLRFTLKPKPEVLPELVLLNVDDASVSALGVYPWPRHYYAYAMRQMKAAGLGRLAFDFQFIDASPPHLNPDGFNALRAALAEGQALNPDDLYAVMIDNDKDLAMATEELGRVSMPFSFAKVESKLSLNPEAAAAKAEAVARFEGKASFPVPVGREKEFAALIDADRVAVNYPIPELMLASESFGFVDNDPDLDGAHRRVRLARVFDGRVYLHLALVTFLRMCGAEIGDVEVYPGASIVIKDAVNPATGHRGDITLPVDAQCAMYLDWIGDFAETARPVSAHALIEYPYYAEQFEMQLMLKDMVSGKGERTELAAKLEELKAGIQAEPDLVKRFPLRAEYRKTREAYDALIGGYLDESRAELDALKTRKAAGEEIDDEAISSVETLITAIRIKTAVESLFDSVAVMGLTATGTQDEGVTPLSRSYWMVGSYPTAINTMAKGRFVSRPPQWAELAAMAVLAFGLALLVHGLKAKAAIAVAVAALAAVNAGIIMLFTGAYLWVDQVSINLAAFLPSIAILSGKFAGEEEKRRFIHGAFSMYLSQEVVKTIMDNPDALKLGGESREITTFFSDIRGFSTIAESLSPEELVHLLNEYLSEMSDAIMRNRGTIDKYEGDAIMAFWGAPLPFDDHARMACLSAVEMQRRLAELRSVWKAGGRHELYVRMGVNTGPAVAGNMGSRVRMNYTAMGDSVNLASRLEGANKQYGTSTMVSQFTYAKVKDAFRFRELDVVRVVGKTEPIAVYELIEEAGKVPERKEDVLVHYRQGLSSYKERRWQEAQSAFVRALRLDKDDGPSKLYYLRCQAFMKTPPPPGWDGVHNLSSK